MELSEEFLNKAFLSFLIKLEVTKNGCKEKSKESCKKEKEVEFL